MLGMWLRSLDVIDLSRSASLCGKCLCIFINNPPASCVIYVSSIDLYSSQFGQWFSCRTHTSCIVGCVCFTFNQHEQSHSANNKNPKPQQKLLLNENKNTNKYQSLFSQSFYFNLTKRCTYIFSSFLLELMLERTIRFINYLKGKKTINKLVPPPKIKPYTAFQHCI